MLDTDDRLAQALDLAYRYLSSRERTEDEVRLHLSAKGIDPSSVERSIDTLWEQGYVDDARFARLFVEDKRSLEQWGSERIKRGLLARGVHPDLVEGILETGTTSGELERAVALLRQRFPSPPRARRERDRALGFLLRKGYDSELSLDALRIHTQQVGRS